MHHDSGASTSDRCRSVVARVRPLFWRPPIFVSKFGLAHAESMATIYLSSFLQGPIPRSIGVKLLIAAPMPNSARKRSSVAIRLAFAASSRLSFRHRLACCKDLNFEAVDNTARTNLNLGGTRYSSQLSNVKFSAKETEPFNASDRDGPFRSR
jgi:hypothetical protein